MTLLDWRAMAERIAAMAAPPSTTQEISLHGGAGRVLAEAMLAAQPVPAVTHAVMDGFALGSLPPGQYRLTSHAPEHLSLDDAVAIAAGQPLPMGAASVVLAGRTRIKEGRVSVSEAQAKDNIRRAGEEATAGAVLLKAGTRLDARHLALASAAAVDRAVVWRLPRVALLALHSGPAAMPHRQILSALLNSPGVALQDLGVSRQSDLAETLKQVAPRQDLVVVVAESLAGEDGALVAGIKGAGGKASVLRAAMKPAKPVIAGTIGNTTIIGLAGTAYATTVAAHLFLRPLLLRMTPRPVHDLFQPAILGFDRARDAGRAEALPVRLIRRENTMVAESAGRFGQLSALAAMDGFALIDADQGRVAADDPVLVHPLLMPLV